MGLNVYLISKEGDTVFDANITHNLGKMADLAGTYRAMWRPEEINADKANDIHRILVRGVSKMLMNPKVFEELNPSNGWGDFDALLNFTMRYAKACADFPESEIFVSR